MIFITYENMSQELVKEIPEIQSQYEELLKQWGDDKPGPHIVYGDVLNPYIITLLESSGPEECLKRIFEFMEELANHEDVKIRDVVGATVCERLIDKKKWIKKAREYMGPVTRKISEDMEQAWYGEKGAPE